MDLRRQIAIVRAWLPLLVVSVVLAAIGALAFSALQPRVYEAKATLIVGQSLSAANPDYDQLLVSQRLSATYAAVATTRPILEQVIDDVGLDTTPDDLAKRVNAVVPPDSTLLTISARDSSAEAAAGIANAVARHLVAASPTIQGRETEFLASIDADLKATQAEIRSTQLEIQTLAALAVRTAVQETQLQALENRLASLRSTYATLLTFSSGNAANLLSVIEPAVPSLEPVSPRPLLNLLLAVVLGLLLATGIAFTAEYLDDTVKNREEIEGLTGLPALGTIVRMKGEHGRREIYRLATLLYPRSGAAENYRTLRVNIEFASVDAPIRTLLVTSSAPGEGKTVTAANLAVAFAQAGRSVLLVDADLRKPGLHSLFGLIDTQGLTSLLRGDAVRADSISHPTEQANLRVLTTGPLPPNPAELLGSQRMRVVVDQLAAESDLVIFDSPPLQAVTDSAILSSFMDGTILVIDAGRTRRRAVRMAREALARAGAHVIGAVLNRLTDQEGAEYAYYYGGDGTGQPSSAAPEPAAEGSGRGSLA